MKLIGIFIVIIIAFTLFDMVMGSDTAANAQEFMSKDKMEIGKEYKGVGGISGVVNHATGK